jgi:hypothetical protein
VEEAGAALELKEAGAALELEEAGAALEVEEVSVISLSNAGIFSGVSALSNA